MCSFLISIQQKKNNRKEDRDEKKLVRAQTQQLNNDISENQCLHIRMYPMYPKIYFFRSKNTPFLQIFQMCKAYSLLKLTHSTTIIYLRRVESPDKQSKKLFTSFALFSSISIYICYNPYETK